MAQPPLTGLTYQQRLGVGFYGEVFRGHDTSGEVRVVHVDPKLATLPGFAGAVHKSAEELRGLDDPRVVIARRVAETEGGTLVVVTDPVKGAIALDDLLRRAGGKLPQDIAVAILEGVVQALGYAHSLKRVHGGVHPRSVLIDFHGGVRLADFALANAFAGTGGGASDYLAPELRHGLSAAAVPSVASDIYAAGSVMGELLLAGGPDSDPPEPLMDVVRRCMKERPAERYLNGTELEEALEAAITRAGQRVALSSEVAAFVTEVMSESDAELDAETENLLSDLGLGSGPQAPVAAAPPDPEPAVAAAPPAPQEPAPEPPAAAAPPAPQEPAPEPPAAAPPTRTRSMTDLLSGLDDARGDAATPPPVATAAPEPAASTDAASDPAASADDDPVAEAEAAAALAVVDALGLEDDGEPSTCDSAPRAPAPAAAPPAAAAPSAHALGNAATEPVLPALRGTETDVVAPEAVDSVPGFDADDTQSEFTDVSDPEALLGQAGPDPISELVQVPHAAQEPLIPRVDETPLPLPIPHDRRPDDELDELLSRKVGAPAESALQPFAGVPAASAPSPAVMPAPEPVAPDMNLSRGRPMFWLAACVFVLAGLGAVIYTQTDLFNPGRAEAEAELAERDRQRQIDEFNASQPVAGELIVESTPGEAAVWLLLGRTPVDSFPVGAGRVHELRVEHDGYQPKDVSVTMGHWLDGDAPRKTEAGLRAEVRVELSPGDPEAPMPAYPPKPEGAAPGPDGRGLIHVESSPAGAQVWMLVGFTPEARVRGLLAGRDYELKLLRDGHRPGFAVVRGDEWYLDGPDSPVKPSLKRAVELLPVAPAADKAKSKRRKTRRKKRR